MLTIIIGIALVLVLCIDVALAMQAGAIIRLLGSKFVDTLAVILGSLTALIICALAYVIWYY